MLPAQGFIWCHPLFQQKYSVTSWSYLLMYHAMSTLIPVSEVVTNAMIATLFQQGFPPLTWDLTSYVNDMYDHLLCITANKNSGSKMLLLRVQWMAKMLCHRADFLKHGTQRRNGATVVRTVALQQECPQWNYGLSPVTPL